MGDQVPSANNNIDIECKIAIMEDEGEGEGEDRYQYFDGRRIQRVPKLMRYKKHNEDYYTPKMVSFGPYYHGFPGLEMAEEFKHKVLTLFVSSSTGKTKKFFYCEVFKVVDQIRNCYVGVSKDAYDDEALAEMMLLDACFAVYLMQISLGDEEKYLHFCQHLGMALLSFSFQDMYLLENQIPLWVIMFFTELIYGNKEEGRVLFYNFLSAVAFGVIRLTRIPGEDKKQPLHLLDASHRVLVQELDIAGEELVQELDNYAGSKKPVNKRLWWPWRKKNPNEFGKYNHQSRSVTDLKAKGIHFKPSSYCLKNIKFKSYTFYGQLQLPVWLFTTHSKQFFIHMIAYEASPESDTDITMICYVNFLKSLIVKPEDVKELREKKILFSTLDSDEQVMEVIKDIDTRGLDVDYYFYDVKKRIEEHCSSKAKTWIAELIHTYFQSPWTCIALLAANFLLCLTFLQTYYTMNPK